MYLDEDLSHRIAEIGRAHGPGPPGEIKPVDDRKDRPADDARDPHEDRE